MNSVQKILLFIGGIFTAVGAMVSIVFIGVSSATGESGVFVVIPLGFVFIGLGFVIGVIISIVNKKIIVKRGNKYVAKIYGYVDNTSFWKTVNLRRMLKFITLTTCISKEKRFCPQALQKAPICIRLV